MQYKQESSGGCFSIYWTAFDSPTGDSNSTDESDERKLRILLDETVRQRAMVRHRGSALQSRAVILVGSSSVIGTVQATVELSSLGVLALVLTVFAVLSGTVALLPKSGKEVNVSAVRDDDMALSTGRFLTKLIDQNLDAEADEQRQINHLALFIKMGFIFLATSIVVLAVATVCGNGVGA